MLKNESLLLLSVNYLNKDIDFSFHCLSELYAKIEYVAKIKEDNENFIIQNITSIDENKEENLKKHYSILPIGKSTNISVVQKKVSEKKLY